MQDVARLPRGLGLAAVLALCLAGAGGSGLLLLEHARPAGAAPGLLGRLCTALDGTGLGCVGARVSRWSAIEVPIPTPASGHTIAVRRISVPVAFLGAAYFVFLGSWFVLAGGPRAGGGRWRAIPLLTTVAGLLASLLLLAVFATGAAPWCAWCVAVHLVNVVLVALVWRGLMSRRADADCAAGDCAVADRAAENTITWRGAFRATAVAAVLVAAIGGVYRQRVILHREVARLQPYRTLVTDLQTDPEFLLREYLAQPRHEIPLRATETGPDGCLEIVIFTDYQCRACACTELQLCAMATRFLGDAARVRLRHFPLCGDCNDAVSGSGHRHACEAARAAEAARVVGGDDAFERMSRLLFAHGERLGPEAYARLAEECDLDPVLLRQHMDSDAVRRVVAGDVALARALGVTGTPAIFLEGRRVPEICRNQLFWRAAVAALRGDRLVSASEKEG